MLHIRDQNILALRLRILTLRLKYTTLSNQLRTIGLKAGFHPDQPRVPAGNPDGGQWTLVGKRPWPMRPRQPVDLVEQERKGGHAIARHVGKSEEYLTSRLLEPQYSYFGLVEKRLNASSSFFDLASANYFVNMTLDAYPDIVDAVRSGDRPKTELQRYFKEPTGYQVYRTETYYLANGEPVIRTATRKTYGVAVRIVRDNRERNGFRVVSAFPVSPEDPGND